MVVKKLVEKTKYIHANSLKIFSWKIEKRIFSLKSFDTLSYDKSIDLLLFRLLCILWSFTKCWSKRAFKSFPFIFLYFNSIFALFKKVLKGILYQKFAFFIIFISRHPFIYYRKVERELSTYRIHQRALVWCKGISEAVVFA